MNPRKSKIVAKIADNRSEVSFLKDLFNAGADVAWLNTAHQDEPQTLEVINKIRQVNPNMAILIDTKGPEVRTKNVDTPFEVKKGDYITFTGDTTLKGPNVVHVTYGNFHNEVPVGEVILYDDASVETIVEEKLKNGIRCVVKNSGLIKNKKSLNIPNVHIKLPALSEKDKSFIHFCAKHNVDYIFHSFVRNRSDIAEIKAILKQYPDYNGKIIAKIENREGFNNTKDILKVCDGLMVARGDLGAEVPLYELPYMQKKMVEAALEAGKYCVVATQVLESMIKNPRPTRAEVTDAANAILDGSGAISMSGETAYGDYPMEATKTMGGIMTYAEAKRDELVHFTTLPKVANTEFKLAKKIVATADKNKAKAIVVMSSDMALTKALSAYRPTSVVVPVGLSDVDAREVTLAYAVRPIFGADATFAVAKKALETFVTPKDKVLVVTQKGKKYTVKAGALKTFKA